MSVGKKIAAFLLSGLLILGMGGTALARDIIKEDDNSGVITLTMSYEGKAVGGGTMTLYQVAKARTDKDGNDRFFLADGFEECEVDLENPSTSGQAELVAEYVARKNPAVCQTMTIGEDGAGRCDGLTPGLYLLVQTKAADGYEAVSPFLVSVPMNENGVYVYDVDATPKMDTLTESLDGPDPTPTPTPGSTLIQTGQLNWPVPVLAFLGLCLFLFGWAMCYGRKKEPHKT